MLALRKKRNTRARWVSPDRGFRLPRSAVDPLPIVTPPLEANHE
jgi:hypothetical protein